MFRALPLSPTELALGCWDLCCGCCRKPKSLCTLFPDGTEVTEVQPLLQFTFHVLSKGFQVARPLLGSTPGDKGGSVPSSFPGSAAQKGICEDSGLKADPTSRDGKGLSLPIYRCQGPGDLVQFDDSGDLETKGLVSGGVETDTGFRVEKDSSSSRADFVQTH